MFAHYDVRAGQWVKIQVRGRAAFYSTVWRADARGVVLNMHVDAEDRFLGTQGGRFTYGHVKAVGPTLEAVVEGARA